MRVFIVLLIAILWPLFSPCQNENISNGNVFDGEPYLAMNPGNPQHMVVAWMGHIPFNQLTIKTRVTFDGGESWSDFDYQPHTNPVFSSADPSLAFDNEGNVYLAYIDFSEAVDSGKVYVRKSVDGGLSWGEPVEVIDMHAEEGKRPIDRPWIAVDRSGEASDGNIYVTTMCAKGASAPFHPYFMKSTNGGESFSTWQHLDEEGWYAGSLIPQPMPTPTVSSAGSFHAVYPSYVVAQGILPQYVIASSSDSGSSFDYHTVFSSANTDSDSLAKKGYLLKSDPSDPQHLAFLYPGPAFGDLDVFIRESFDGGITWSDRERVNDDPIGNDRMQDLIWADFDMDGDLVVSWRDRRNAPDSGYQTETEIWGAVRMADSTGFSDNFQISDTAVEHDSILNSAGNDFMCIRLRDDTLNAVWGDTRNGKLNIWFQRLDLSGFVLSTTSISTEEIPGISMYPNPVDDVLTIVGNDIYRVDVLDLSGRKVISKNPDIPTHALDVYLTNLPAASYLVEVHTGKGVFRERLLKN